MRKSAISVLSFILALLMLFPALVACTGGNEVNDDTTNAIGSEPNNDETTSGNEVESDKAPDDGDETEDITDVQLEGVFGDSIAHSSQLANGVQTYYTESQRKNYKIENQNMNLLYSLTDTKMVSSITNKNGGVYISNTMDVFVKMVDGERIFASDSQKDIRPNIYRLGYYYYDVHFLENDFKGEVSVDSTLDIDPELFAYFSKGVAGVKVSRDGEMMVRISGGDPYIVMAGGDEPFTFSADDYNAISFSVKSTKSNSVQIYYISEGDTGHTDPKKASISIANDGEYHTYTIILSEGSGFTGDISRIRIDFEGSEKNEVIYLKDIKLAKSVTDGPAALYFDRTFHTYSDKLHQELHFMATQKVTGIEEFGMITEIPVETVDKIVVKDASDALHTDLEGVDWDTAEYIGFDIKGAGIFGYILPAHKDTGKMVVEIVDGNYVITQTFCPEGGTMDPINAKVTFTDNDFFTGNRIYTDESHSFDAFLREAEWERHPFSAISSDDFVEYEAFKGAYLFSISGTGFNPPFFYEGNYHYTASAKMRSDVERPIYIRTSTTSGCLESAVVLDQNDLILPIYTEVSKNFGGEDEEPLFNAGDRTYGETIFPLVLPANERVEFTVLNLYQNWGITPLKQLSSIQYFWPYYHLSVGTTETSCISPWYGATDLWTLPDFRSQSMPYWFELDHDMGYSNQPQHTHAGYQFFLQYTDSNGKQNATENISNVIDSSGPLYVDVDMTYVSDDGKIKVYYTHVEMPQEDELRAYYEIKYEILEEVTINDFANDFSFYSFKGYAGYYRNMGYWAENGSNDGIVYKETNGTKTAEKLVLGNDSPYVALYNLYSEDATWANNNANLGFVIHSSEIVLGGEKIDDNFVLIGKEYLYSLSMDLGKVTLKPGDTINLNMIITPWGHYDSTTDTSMQNIRENTCLNPLSVNVSVGEKIESVYVPKILSTDGKTAEFTLTGGTSNVVARVYGFDKLTAPKIYEKIDGEWVEYVTSSINTPDKMGNKHYYDGYYAYYDGNGTYSYAFVADMTDVESRTFKIDASEDFTRWPKINEEDFEAPINVYVPASNIYPLSNGSVKGVSLTELSEDASFVRYYGDGQGTPEAYFQPYSTTSDISSGAYVVVKYRIPASNPENNYFQFYTSTDAGASVSECILGAGTVYKDGEWHIMVVDIAAKNHKHFAHSGDGETYYAKYLRIDIFNVPMATTSYVDIAYVGMTDDLNKLFELEKLQDNVCNEVGVFGNGSNCVFYDLDGNIVEGSGSGSGSGSVTPTPTEIVYIDPDNAQGYTQSETPYLSGIDYINGNGDNDPNDQAYNSYRSNQVDGPKVVNYDKATVGNAYLALAGWTCVYEGIEKFVWSADGGKTWHDAVLYNREQLSAAAGGVMSAANGHFASSGIEGFDKETYNQEYYAGSAYQASYGTASGIAAHLIDYIGQEVDVTFAAVPKNAPTTLCLIGHIQNVRVYESDEAAEAGEVCKHTAPECYKFVDDNDNSTDAAIIQRTCKCGEVVFETRDPQYVLLFDRINGVQVAPLVCENTLGFLTINSTSFKVRDKVLSFTVGEDGLLSADGWAGLNGGISDIVFKVYGADGTELTSGWTSSKAILTTRQDIASEMTRRGIETSFGRGFKFTINLAGYISAKDDVVSVTLALVANGASAESQDKYVYLCDITDITVPAEPIEIDDSEETTEDSTSPEEIVPSGEVAFIGQADYVTGASQIRVSKSTKNEPIVVDFESVTSTGMATIDIVGWVGASGGIDGIAYKITGDGASSEWLNLTPGLRAAEDAVKDAITSAVPAISKAHAYRYSGTVDLRDYVGKTVSVTFAIVSSASGDYIPFLDATNIQVVCDHSHIDSKAGYIFVDDGDASTDSAKIASTCICGQFTVDPKNPAYVMFFGSLGTQSSVSPLAMENKHGYRSLDATTLMVNDQDKSFTADVSGVLKITGWAGVNGEIADIVFKVFDANGNLISNGWVSTGASMTGNHSDLVSEMEKRGIEAENGVKYTLSIDLSSYLSGNTSVTVQLGFEIKDAPQNSNDRYVSFGEFTRVSKAS